VLVRDSRDYESILAFYHSIRLETLVVIVVDDCALERRYTASSTSPANSATLSVLSDGATAGSRRGASRGWGSCRLGGGSRWGSGRRNSSSAARATVERRSGDHVGSLSLSGGGVDIEVDARVAVGVSTREGDELSRGRSKASAARDVDLSTFRVELSR